MNYYAVIDTNVLVSALLRPKSIPGIVLKEALGGRVIPLLNSEILDEYGEDLSRRKFSFDQRNIRVVLDGLVKRALFIDAGPVDEYLPDPKDVVFLCSYHGKTERSVVTPKQMLEIINEDVG